MPHKAQEQAKSGKKRFGFFHRKKSEQTPTTQAAPASATVSNSGMADLLGGSSAGNPALDQMMQTRAAGLAGRADAPRRSRLPQLNLDLDQPVGDAAAPASAQVVPEEQPAAAAPVQAPQVESTDSGADQPVKEFLMELLATPQTPIRVEGESAPPQETAPPAATADSAPPALSQAEEDAFLKADPPVEIAAAAAEQAVSAPPAVKTAAAIEEKIEAAVPAAEGETEAASAATTTTELPPELEQEAAHLATTTTTTTESSPELEEAEADGADETATAAPQVADDGTTAERTKQERIQKGTRRLGSFVDLRDQLVHSKKGGIGMDSSLFRNVKSCTEAVVKAINESLPGDPQGNQAAFQNLQVVYKNLLTSCRLYIAHRDPKTSDGKARKGIVSHIMEQAEKDFFRLARIFDRIPTLPPQEQPKTTLELLGMARTRKVALKNGPINSLKQAGDAISKLYEVKPGDATDKNTSGFFKQAMTLRPFSAPQWRPGMTAEEREDLDQVRLLRTLIQRKSENKAFGELLIGQLEHTSGSHGLNAYDYTPTREAKLFDLDFAGACSQARSAQFLFDEMLNSTFFARPPESDIGVTNRNVATSRLANALGIGDVVVQSELATLQGSGESPMSGILMQKAPGKSALDALDEDYGEEALDTANPRTIFRKLQSTVSDVRRLFSPQFLHTLTNLQVLDALAGQEDRHTGNYFVERTSSGQLGAVHGIDNEMAFGLDTFHTLVEGSPEPDRMGNFGFNFLTSDGEIRLPYMDKQLADRIMALTPQDLQLLLGDVLEKPYLDALCTRVREAQAAIARDREADPTGRRYLEREDQWDANVMEALISPSSKERFSYVGDLFATAEKGQGPLPGLGSPTVSKLADQYLTEEREKIWVSLKDEKNRIERLKSFGSLLGDDVIQYMTDHQDDFQYTAEEVKEPDVVYILSGIDCCSERAIARFAAEQERRRKAKAAQA